MVSQLTTFLAAVSVALPLMIKAAGAVGLLGSSIEAIGLFMGKFANPRVQAVGGFLVRVGKTLEAIGIDAPKVLSNALAWVTRISKLLGVGNATLVALVVLGCVFGVDACTAVAAPCTPADTVMAAHALECAARVRAECSTIPDDQCPAVRECDAWGDARCGFAGGAP